VGVDQDDILVAGFEAFQLFQRGVEGAAGGVDAVLEPGEGVVALLEALRRSAKLTPPYSPKLTQPF
jgi:hypothetical protein